MEQGLQEGNVLSFPNLADSSALFSCSLTPLLGCNLGQAQYPLLDPQLYPPALSKLLFCSAPGLVAGFYLPGH